METFKSKLKKLFNNPKYNLDEMRDNDPDRHFIKLIYEQQRKIRNNSRNNYSKENIKNNSNNSSRIYNNNRNDYNLNLSNNKNLTFRRNKSQKNINRKYIKPLFTIEKITNEKNMKNINTLMRSFTLKDIHNSEENLNLSRSYSQIDINDNKRSKDGLKKKISYMKKKIGLDEEVNNKMKFNPKRYLNNNLYNFHSKDYYAISPSSRVSILKRKNLNYPDNFFWDYHINKDNITNRIINKKNHLRVISDFNNFKKENYYKYIKFP